MCLVITVSIMCCLGAELSAATEIELSIRLHSYLGVPESQAILPVIPESKQNAGRVCDAITSNGTPIVV